MALGGEQALVGQAGPLVGQALHVQRVHGCARSLRRAQHAQAFPPGGSGQPAGQRGRIADPVQLVD
jgi:hypothetical protein